MKKLRLLILVILLATLASAQTIFNSTTKVNVKQHTPEPSSTSLPSVPAPQPLFNCEYNAATGRFPDQTCPAWQLTNTDMQKAPVLSKGSMIVNTTSSGNFMFYKQTGTNVSFPANAEIQARMKVDTDTGSVNFRAGAWIEFVPAPYTGNTLYIGMDNVFLLTGPASVGPSANVDTHLSFHTYTITVNNTGAVQIYQDDALILTGSTYYNTSPTDNGPIPLIEFGEGGGAAYGASEWETFRHNANPTGCVQCTPPPSGLVSWWPGEGDGNDLLRVNSGTLEGGVNFVQGKVARAFNFNGVDGDVNVPNSVNLNFVQSDSFSIDYWVSATSVPPAAASSTAAGMYVLNKESGSNSPGYQSAIALNGSVTFFVADGLNSAFLVSSKNVLDGAFHHITLVRDKALGEILLYVDGALDRSTADPTGDLSNSLDFFIGARDPSVNSVAPNNRSFFQGVVDEVQVYNRALGLGEVQSIFNDGSLGNCRCVHPPSGLVSWWRLDGNANDVTGANPGTIVGSGGQFVPAKVGLGFQSGGAGSLIQVNDTASLDPSQFTIDAWINMSVVNSGTFNMPLIYKGDQNGFDVNTQYGLGIFGNPGSANLPPGAVRTGAPAPGKLFFDISDGVTDQELVSNTTVPAGTFVHIAASVDSSTVRLYFNGKIDAEASLATTIKATSSPLQIGSCCLSSQSGHFLNGVIDEVDLYSRSLAQSETQSIFDAGTLGKCKPTVTWTQLSPSVSPSPRNANSMAYDVADGYVLLFGGQNNTGSVFMNDTWEFKAGRWTQLTTTVAPSSRSFASMTYDTSDGYILLFGGFNGTVLSDTWEFKAGTWTQLFPSTSPPARNSASMTFDDADGYVLLFGGDICCTGPRIVLSDTWIFKSGEWTQFFPTSSPSPRTGSSMAYDAADSYVVLFGGSEVTASLSDTWEFKAGSWTQLSPSTSPSGRDDAPTAFDATDNYILLFTGVSDTGAVPRDTWEFKAESWTQLFPSISPPPRYYATNSIAYDAADGYVVLFGGDGCTPFAGEACSTILSDTWKYGPLTALPPSPIAVNVNCATSTVGKPVDCTAAASGGTGGFSFSWSAPGGTPSTGSGATFTTAYSTKGSETVTVTATDSSSTTAQSTTTFTVAAQSLVVNVSCGAATAGKTVACTVAATGGTGPYSFSWSSNGNPLTGIGTDYSTSFASKGSQAVAVTATDANGVSKSGSTSITVTAQPLIVAAACPPSGLSAGKSFSCTVSASGGTGPYSGTGSFSVTQPVKGIFTETFSATDANGVTASGTSTVTIAPQPLIVTVDCGSGQTAGKAFTCTVSASGGTTPYTGTGTVSRAETTKGAKTESFTVTDANGVSSSGSARVNVSAQPLIVTVSCPTGGVTAGKAFSCTVSVTGGTSPYTGTGSQSVTHAAKGTFTETFSVTDANHATASGSATVTVASQPLSTDFTTAPTSPISGQLVSFTATATGGTSSYSFTWNFGDSSPSSTGSSVQHTFTVTATTNFNVVVTAKDANGITTSAIHTITISPAPLHTTASRLTCTPRTVDVDQPTDCNFTLTDTASNPTTPQGTANFSSDSTGTFAPGTICTLSQGSAPLGTSGCEISYTPTAVGSGIHTITVTYSGDSLHASSAISTGLNVNGHAEVKCGGDDTCSVKSNSTITNADADKNKIRLTATGAKGTVGWANVTLPRAAVPNIDKLQVRVDGVKIPSSSILIKMDSSNYYVYFTFTFHSPVNIEVDYSPPQATILGLDPSLFYGSFAGLVVAVIGGVAIFLVRRNRASNRPQSLGTGLPKTSKP